jgi:FAD/FMN-containing dehydrogenase
MKNKQISNWTNYPVEQVAFEEHSFVDQSVDYVKRGVPFIARGNGRCYGDASLSKHVLSTLSLNNILSFNHETGVFRCQSGVLLSDILAVIVPKGWFLPVTPGTKFITIGGAIASNVHGKNHHKEGGFSKHVSALELLQPDGRIVNVTPTADSELFDTTCGGMGLTGVVLSAEIQLKKIETSFMRFKSIKASSLREAMDLFETYKDHTYSMAWIDCMKKGRGFGRSIVMLGEHAEATEIAADNKLYCTNKTLFSMPFNFPSWVLNPLSIKAFNWLYYNKQIKKEQNKYVHYDGFYYPLDAILSWNKMYGKQGFIQYQPVFPLEASYEGLKEVLEAISSSGYGSFLAVLKLMGKEDNEISFPMEGFTLALDFPIKKGLFEFLDRLDEIVLRHGGRLYLSKDARMSKTMFKESYKNSKSIFEKLNKFDSKNIISSGLSQRLGLK